MPPKKMVGFGQKFFLPIFVAGVCLIALSFSGCATNPITGQAQFMTVSEEREFSIGQQVDKQVREEMGVYLEDIELRSLVKEVGAGISKNTARAKMLNYRFEIINDPDFNAFALPGGFVYVHRGLLEKINSTDELASVLGHEIAHVDARHSAAQLSKAEMMQVGLLAVSLAAPNVGNLLNLGAVLTLNKFSRDAEREADHYGTLYMTQAGYNPKSSFDVMQQIQRIQRREPSATETWFMTHPPTSERLVNLNHEIDSIQQTNPATVSRAAQRNQYIRALDGLAVGEWNGQELIKGDCYYNKEFLLNMKLPEGWQGQINSQAYTAVFGQPKKDFYLFFNIEPLRVQKTSEEYFSDFETRLGKNGLKKEGQTTPGFMKGTLKGIYKGSSGSLGAIKGVMVAFVNDANGYYVLGICKQADFETFRPQAESMMQSFAFITQKEATDLQPGRLKVHEVKGGETWDSIMKKYFSASQGKEKLAEYNGFEVNQNPQPGILLKIPPTLHFK